MRHRVRVAVHGDDRTEKETETALFLASYRKELMRVAASGSEKQRIRVEKRRFARDRARKALKAIRQGKRPVFSKDMLVFSRYSDGVIPSTLKQGRRQEWVPLVRRRPSKKYAAISLKEFSFIDNPQHTLDKIKEILDFECHAVGAQLHFDDHYIVDVAPYLVLAEIWPQLAKVFRGGRMDRPVQKVIHAIGLRRDLMMQLKAVDDERGLAEDPDVWAFPKRRRRPAGSSRDEHRNLQPQPREKVADEFCEMLDDWFGEATKELSLTKQGKGRFANIIGELLDNAERHSNAAAGDGSWSTAAFMARRTENDVDVYRCHMAFLSVGRTIAEGLETAPTNIRSQIDEYCQKHIGCGVSKETLATLVALQDGVTRDADAEAKGRGGVGLQEVLELINIIGVTNQAGKEPRMTIVSGRSCIQARYPHLQGIRNGLDDRRFLWFNDQNSPEKPPEQEFVFDLSSHFPGTIIGLTFVLSKEDLLAVLDADDRAGTTDEG